MTGASSSSASPSPLAPLVDETRLGSPGGQALVGVTGIVLAVVLVIGQLSLATTRGISVHLHASVEHITEGNEVMSSVIERAAPSVEMERVVAGQAKTLANTRAAMARTNGELGDIGDTTARLDGVVAGMEATSSQLADGVAGMDRDTAAIGETLGGLPGTTDETHAALRRINGDTGAINTELKAIAAKMRAYGLPRAQGAPRG